MESYANLIPSETSDALRAYLANPDPSKEEIVDGLFHGTALPTGTRIEKFQPTVYLPPYLRGFHWPGGLDPSAVYATHNMREAIGYARNALARRNPNSGCEAQLYILRTRANRLVDIPRDLRPDQGLERHIAVMRAFIMGADTVRIPLRRARTHVLMRDPDRVEIVSAKTL